MRSSVVAVAALLAVGLGCGGSSSSGSSDPITEVPDGGSQPSGPVSFSRDVQPIFNARCAPCHPSSHSPDLQQGSAWSDIVGVPSDCDPSMNRVEPGDPSQSMLYRNISGTGCETMPPGRPLSQLNPSQTRTIELWIQQGAPNN